MNFVTLQAYHVPVFQKLCLKMQVIVLNLPKALSNFLWFIRKMCVMKSSRFCL